jgi:hypothetical protein
MRMIVQRSLGSHLSEAKGNGHEFGMIHQYLPSDVLTCSYNRRIGHVNSFNWHQPPTRPGSHSETMET